ncbi:MAG: hypothetical protein ACI8XU_001797 [Kiritimatiellia bacterium]|jgi:hypothetical protein
MKQLHTIGWIRRGSSGVSFLQLPYPYWFNITTAYTLKAEQNYQGLRQQESDFYDIARHLLDHADPEDPKLKENVDRYIQQAEAIRRTARKVETAAPPSARDTT